ncbi:MAG: ABC transporter ATP-binding protein [Bryobacteraceae bacterium]
MPPLVEFHNVSVARGQRRVLDSITFSIAEGEHAAILGPNGSGKSTLLRAVARDFYPLQSGAPSWVRVLGRDRWNIFDLRPLLGIVSDELMAACRRDLTAREAILSGFFSSIGLWTNHQVTAAMHARTEQVLATLEIERLADRPVEEMSAGESRRVLIGRALVHDPRALILDEPANSLDHRAMLELRDILRKLARGGISLILATHHLPDIIPEIDRVILLKDGRIFRDGAKHDVLRSDVLSELFGGAAEVVPRDGYFQLW